MLRGLLFSYYFFLLLCANAQSTSPVMTVYCDQNGLECKKKKAVHYVKLMKKDSLWFIRDYYMNDALKMVGAYSDDALTMEEGLFVYFTEQGFKREECEYKKGKLIGDCKYWNEKGEPVPALIFFSEKMPIFPGGHDSLLSFISRNTIYPPNALEKGLQGRVVCQFIIKTDGSLSDITIIKSVEKSLDNEAKRIISIMPKWEPGEQNNKAVPVKYTLPIIFSIKENPHR